MPRTRRYRIEIEIVTDADGEQDFSYIVEAQGQRDSTVWNVAVDGTALNLDNALRAASSYLRKLVE